MKIHLLLSFHKGNRMTSRKISCGGVVVRTESVPGEDYFNVAVFFNDVPKRDAASLADYVHSALNDSQSSQP